MTMMARLCKCAEKLLSKGLMMIIIIFVISIFIMIIIAIILRTGAALNTLNNYCAVSTKVHEHADHDNDVDGDGNVNGDDDAVMMKLSC